MSAEQPRSAQLRRQPVHHRRHRPAPTPPPAPATPPVTAPNGKPLRIVVFVQENKSTDFMFASMAAWGAAVANHGNLQSAPPGHDQPHDRNAWVHYAVKKDYPALTAQIDSDAAVPFYSWLAKMGTFSDHHFGAGSNSTSGHMLAVGGQTPTFKNPPFGSGSSHPVWDLPNILTHAQAAGVSVGAFPDQDQYPIKFYKDLNDPSWAANVHTSADFISMAKAGTLPEVCYVWSPSGYDEHPPLNPGDTTYMAKGEDLKWQQVQAVVDAGEWDNTVFILTYDDWGGYADSVPTPNAYTLPDAQDPNGAQAVGGTRIPLLMFGGMVQQGIDSSWHSHAGIIKTIIDLKGLQPMGIPLVDQENSLASRVSAANQMPTPPAYGSTVVQPTPPAQPPAPVEPAPWPPAATTQPMPAISGNNGVTYPAPTDGTVRKTPPPDPNVAAATPSGLSL